MYQGNDRVKQVNWLDDDDMRLPNWFDQHDRELLIERTRNHLT